MFERWFSVFIDWAMSERQALEQGAWWVVGGCIAFIIVIWVIPGILKFDEEGEDE